MKYVLSVICLFTQFISSGQNIQKLWDKRLGGTNTEDLYAICDADDGSFLLGGSTYSGIGGDKTQNSRGEVDFWVVKVDADGNKIWDKRFGGEDDEYLTTIIKSSTDYYYVGGSSQSGISGDKTETSRGVLDFWLVKIDKNGNKIWDKRFGSASFDYIESIIETDDKGFLLCGTSSSNTGWDKSQASRGYSDYWVVKIDSNGTKLWDKTYGGNGYEYLNDVIKTKDNNIILCGGASSGLSGEKTENNRGSLDFWLIKITQNGDILWDKRFGSNDVDEAYSVVEMPNGNLMIGGYTWSENAVGDKTSQDNSPIDFWVIQTTATGIKIWDKTYGSILSDELKSLVQTPDGGFLLGGNIKHQTWLDSPLSHGSTDYYLIKIDPSGEVRWSKNFGGEGLEELNTIHRINDDTYILAGSSASLAGGDKTQDRWGGSDFWLMKVKDCYPPVLNISGISANPTYRAGEILQSNQNVSSNTNYFAANGIVLLPDFTVQIGTVFKAEIKGGCNN